MKPVDQTKFGQHHGNCFAACVASILEIPIEVIPELPGDNTWTFVFREWLKPLGFTCYTLTLGDDDVAQGYTIMAGMSPRGKWLHAVVALDGVMVHDPHPDRTGVRFDKVPIAHTIMVALDPSVGERRVYLQLRAKAKAAKPALEHECPQVHFTPAAACGRDQAGRNKSACPDASAPDENL